MKKHLTLLLVALICSVSAWGTDYYGTLVVTTNTTNQTQQDVLIIIEKKANGKYKAIADDLNLIINGRQAHVGRLEYDDLTGTTGSNGKTTISGTKSMTLRDIDNYSNLADPQQLQYVEMVADQPFNVNFTGEFDEHTLTATISSRIYLVADLYGGMFTTEIINDNITCKYNGEADIEPTDKKMVETFEKIPTTLAAGTPGEGDIASWKTGNSSSYFVDYKGSRQVAMILPSTIQTTTPLYLNAAQVVVDFTNAIADVAKIALYYSIDNGSSWQYLYSTAGVAQHPIQAGQKVKVRWDVSFDNTQGVLYRIAMLGGNRTNPCYLDNFTIYYTGEPGPPSPSVKPGDFNDDGNVDVTDVSILIDVILGKSVSIPDGVSTDLNGDGNTDVTDVSLLIDVVLGKIEL